MNTHLMMSRRFAPLFWTQFLSAFNDNFLKNTLVFLILFTLAKDQAASLVTLAGAIFMAPFLLLSALGGEIADRFDKALIARRLKFVEIAAAGVSVVGIALSSIPVLMGALLMFGIISALFGPIKYGILPDHLERKELPKANAWIESATFAAILGGTIAGGVVSADGIGVTVFGPIMMALAVGCWLASRYIPSTGSAAPNLVIDKNIFRSTWHQVAELRTDMRIWRAGLMTSWFWLVGAIVLSILPSMIKDSLGGNEIAVTAYLAVFAVSIAIGSAIAAWMSQGRMVLLPAPVGTALLALFGLHLAWTIWSMQPSPKAETLAAFFAGPNTIRVAVDLAGMAIAAAFLVVPTFAAVQAWSPEARRARVVAAVSIVNAGFMTIGGILVAAIQAAGVSIAGILFGLVVANAIAAWLMLKFLPTNPFRDFVSILFRAFLRLEVEGLDNLKAAGKAPILALNHVSFLDGPLALTLTDEEPVFAIDYTIAQAWWMKPFMKLARALPLNPAKPMSTRTLIKIVQGGDPLVIFPEGRITVTGGLMKVYDGAAMVADKTGSMVVPVRIDGLEKSYFSRLTSQHVRRRLFPKVKVTILEPVKLEVQQELKGRQRRAAAGSALYQVMSDLVFRTQDINKTVLEKIIETAHERGMKELAVQDPVTGSLSYGKLLTAAAVLGEKFEHLYAGQETLGIMLPNANGACAALLGVVSAGKVPAMINFTAGAANILSACKAAEVRTVLTSRAFVEQAKLGPVVEEIGRSVDIVWLDDLRATIGLKDKLLGLLRKATPRVARKPDDPAAILFTSGSEGTPKGVVLTHRNILANAAQAASRIDFHSGDKVFNVLPIFHSFGMTAGTVLPLISGVPVYFYPSPLHYRIVPELIYASNATIIFGTDTFLSGYARTAHPYDFRSVRYCFAGAEPVKAATRTTYMEKFGLRILEGYGVTETAPVIAINTPMYNKSGSVGKIMPGMEYRLEPVPGVDEGGLLFVRGPNVMAGYLRAENPGVIEPLADGWHDTGDVVTVDDAGFISIRGRAKRFAKIAGEMVSLAAVEALAGELWKGSLSAVATLPDARKGEKLILITEAANATRAEFLAFAKANGAMDLMVPAEVRVVPKVPVLGSGKLDFAGVTRMVRGPEELKVKAA
ncbi:acyl-[ACP]--phospholipid O-acyltransferase [Mesorhizobium sp. M2D.F.Ca.ET.185.01.1.1]|uniref:acyl-[ACP]--phospholipid O-acyltransferase n=1 Tax=unclassified Mesorhizobium TaxID=325217 RepID=UPI000FCA522A|nr:MULTISPECIES: acyl-[ACP]--phospholipid O-acyltransferase [unclassified Mesorhizobium]TGP75041.1 acyl-[ACP]--phospholipid O-acyltransferase [bacterium M00.F.Ca.ET.227.01.1.1]TGP85368.1 acyl-[ACP]--phospholipid O-acyltransferase [bacterium M00.F.Ca.ET.221.01.1.1]TGP89794.1 acyl-[ACP]--phospholipid O-acyltransferase [bacterium M00.F.Ca.ET.222.01.1.1]TGT67707.1 acyl-[ACP]--phospholipid O-acyltransferase [bacterium M00.F.Ca.ET.159.01.1.1]TGT80147.1 acyl-[ACP]--phospholipid O-acyltransferase [bac